MVMSLQIMKSNLRHTSSFAVLALLPFILFLSGCIKEEEYSHIPEISYEGIQLVYANDSAVFPSRGIIVISFQDGDGDLGLDNDETSPPYDSASGYYYNYVIRYFEKHDTGYVEPLLATPFSTRIPVLNQGYEGKPLKGTIVDTLVMDPSPDYDTIRFELFIYDRALNKSNVLTTPDIVLRRTGI